MGDPAAESKRARLAVLADWVKAYPSEALNVLIETGRLEQFGWCYVTGQRLGDTPTLCRDEPKRHRFRQPLYRVVPKTEETER
jgi:hypothetical protein